MSTILHLRVGFTGDIMVFVSPLREVFLLPQTMRRAFLNAPDLVTWRRISTRHGLACLRWGGEDLEFEMVNVRDFVAESDVAPCTKGLRVYRRDGAELLYLPYDLWPEQAADIRRTHRRLVDIVTPRIAGFEKVKRFALADHVPVRVLHLDIEIPEPDSVLPPAMRGVVSHAINREVLDDANGDYLI